MGRIFVQILCMFGKIPNCIFVLITGYFLITSDAKKHYRKIVPLIAEMFFYSVLIYFGIFMIQQGSIFEAGGMKGAIKAIFPFFFGDNWFIIYYILLYMIIPFLNPWLKAMNKKNYTIFVCILLFIWSVIPTLTGAYDFSHMDFFLVMYILGAYIRLHIHGKTNYKNQYNLIAGVSVAVVIITSVLIACLISYFTKSNFCFNHLFHFIVENSIISVICAVSIFMYFSNIHFYSKVVNEVAASVLGIYLIHDNANLRLLLWTKFWPNANYVNFPYIHAFCKIIGVFIVCLLIDFIRRKTIGAWFEHWFYKNCDRMIMWIKKRFSYLNNKL